MSRPGSGGRKKNYLNTMLIIAYYYLESNRKDGLFKPLFEIFHRKEKIFHQTKNHVKKEADI